MPPDEKTGPTADTLPWQTIAPDLLGVPRRRPPAFPLRVLPGRWREWVELGAHAQPAPDLLALAMMGAVSAVCGGGVVVHVTQHWREPLLLWLALVGEASSGKSAALAAGRRLLDPLQPDEGDTCFPRCMLLSDPDHWLIRASARRNPRGVMLWRDDLADWLRTRARGEHQADMVAGWSAGRVLRAENPVEEAAEPLALALAGTLDAARLDSLVGAEAAASRLLFAWPEASDRVSLTQPDVDDAPVVAMLRRIGGLMGPAGEPSVIGLEDPTRAQFEEIVGLLRQHARQCDGLEAAWVGKGASAIARIAAMFELMDWAPDETRAYPEGVTLARLEDAWTLWSEYLLPQAEDVFGRVGSTDLDRLGRRVVRWLKRTRHARVSARTIRREALAEAVDAENTETVIALLEAGGVLRLPPPTVPGPGRKSRQWEVNPALR